MPKPEPSKKEAIVAIGLEKRTSEIISIAAEQGVKVSRTYVDLLKQRSGAGEKVPRNRSSKPERKRAAKKGSKRRASGRDKKVIGRPAAPASSGSKAAYVRGFPAGTKAAEIVAQGRDAGLVLTTAYVYKVRGKAVRSPAEAPLASLEVAAAEAPAAESAFRLAVLEMVLDAGLPAARAHFEDVVAKVLSAVASV